MAGPRDDKIHPLPLGLPLCGQQPPRGFGRLQHAPPAPDQAQGGIQPLPASASPGQPRPASANRQIYSGWPAIPVSFPPRLPHAPTRAHRRGAPCALGTRTAPQPHPSGCAAALVALTLTLTLAPTLAPTPALARTLAPTLILTLTPSLTPTPTRCSATQGCSRRSTTRSY